MNSHLLRKFPAALGICLCITAMMGTATADENTNHEKTVFFPGYAISDSLDYSAESVRYLYDEKKVVLQGNARISYQGHILESGEITYYQDYDYVEAYGIPDSTGVYRNTPVFTDPAGQSMTGFKIKYNLKTQKGFIEKGRSKYDSGYMAASKIKRAANDTLYIADGTYTTCDYEDDPHFYFGGKRMKFILNDKLIIKPIVGYLHNIPVFWFPFYVFPIKKGRQSGFLTPRYGSSRRDGRYFSNLGYYFAQSDYTDYRFAGTIRERNGWLVNNWFNYNQRYALSGSMFGSWENREEQGSRTQQYKLRLSHRQTVSPTLSIDGSGRFESTSYSQYNSQNLYERLSRDMRSTLTMTKRWRESGNSLIATTSYNKNLDNETTETSLPNISFTKPRKLLFGSEAKGASRKYSSASASSTDSQWYNSIYYSLNARLNNSQTERKTGTDFTRTMNMSTSLSSSQKFRGWLVSEPSLNVNEDFSVTNTVDKNDRYRRADNISAGLRLGTTIYGMFKPPIGSINTLRHVITPSVSWSYGKRRNFYTDNTEAFYRFDRNQSKSGKSNTMNISLRNLFQAKTIKGDKESKVDLFRLDFSSSVDFERDEQKVSPLVTSFDFMPLKIITTRLTATHIFYDENDTFNLFDPTLNDLNVTTRVGLSQQSLGFMGMSSRSNVNASLERDEFDMRESGGNESVGSGGGKAFDLQFSHTYGLRRQQKIGPDIYKATHTIKPELSFSPSANFSVRYYCYFDIEQKNIVDQRILIGRDLHCWEANVSWVPSGYREGFYFKVNIKELPDVKVEQRRGSSRLGY